MTRTTVNLDASVLAELRQRAAREGKSMGTLASELLARQLSDERCEPAVAPFHWISRDLGLPRVHLEDQEALNALLDGPT